MSAPSPGPVAPPRPDRLIVAALCLLTIALGGALAGLAADPRLVAGMPVWLKPAKFAASTMIYLATLLWIFRWLPEWPRLRRWIGRGTAVVFLLEIAIIYTQAWRGRTSHFNVATLLDGVLFGVMGTAIVAQTVAAAVLCAALFRQRFSRPALGWAFRLGLAISIVGSATGGLMTRPTPQQMIDARAGRGMPISGAHTVGAPDGGPGMPGTGWSTAHGDLRVPHFVGMHALQLLPVLCVLVARRRSEATTTRIVVAAAGLYATLFVILLVQALWGEPLLHPGPVTTTALVVWGVTAAAAAVFAVLRPSPFRVALSA